MPHPINQNYFDRETKAADYVLGATYSCCWHNSRERLAVSSKRRHLVDLIHKELGSGHRITPRGNFHCFIATAPELIDALIERGVEQDRKQRAFPEVNYLDHFMRGFMEAEASIRRQGSRTNMEICYNNNFLAPMHRLLQEQAGVRRSLPKNNAIVYAHKDACRIHDYIYQDRGYIKKSGLYLPEIHQGINTGYTADWSARRKEQRTWIESAKELLIQGKTAAETAEILGKDRTHLSYYFKKITGMTVLEFQRAHNSRKRRR